MPIYEYSAKNASKSCPFCVTSFECTQRISEAPLTRCPHCSAPVVKLVSRPAIGWSRTGLDGRAKAAGKFADDGIAVTDHGHLTEVHALPDHPWPRS